MERSGTAVIVASRDSTLFSEWLKRSWQHLSGARLVLVPYGPHKDSIRLLAPDGTIICPAGNDTSLEANRNEALKALRTKEIDFVAFMDDDTFVDQQWLDEMLKAAKASQETAAFASVVRTCGSSDIQACGHVLKRAAPHDVLNSAQEPLCPCGNCAFVRWPAIKRIAERDSFTWDPRFNQWQTCFDFGLKLVLTGSRTKIVRKATAQHRGYKTWGDQLKNQKKDTAPVGQLTSRYLLYLKFAPAELRPAIENEMTGKVTRWRSRGYPGFEQWLSGNAIQTIIDCAKANAVKLWKERPNETWQQLMAECKDAKQMWGL